MNIKQEYIDILVRIAPGPLGKGMTLKQTAKDLGIGRKAAKYRLTQFKKKYPEAWDNFLQLRKLSRQDRYKLRWNFKELFQVHLKTFTDLAGDNTIKDTLEIFEDTGKIKRFLGKPNYE